MILIAERPNTSKYGTVLSLWYVDGKHQIVRRPFDHYFYSFVEFVPNYSTKQNILVSKYDPAHVCSGLVIIRNYLAGMRGCYGLERNYDA